MICESCPIQNGGTTNASNWGDWFVPYFNIIKNNTNIKSFIYISDPWDKPGFFGTWPDSRISSNENIRLNYKFEMQDSIYIHMEEYLNNPNIIQDTLTPAPVTNFIAKPGNKQVELVWKNPSNPDFYSVRILRKTGSFSQNQTDGTIIFEGKDSTFIDINLENDTTYFYTAYTFDFFQNFSPFG